MTCSRNLYNHFKICYQTKTNVTTWFFYFLQIYWLFSWKKREQTFSFHIYFSRLWKFSNPKKRRGKKKRFFMTCVFEMFWITWSHFERITYIFAYDGCNNHFWRKYFHILFCGDKVSWTGCTCAAEVAEKIKCQKMNVNFLQPN
jgi:hypothetical protein